MTSATTAAAAAHLEQRLAGELVLPQDAGYDATRAIHNGLIDKRPGMIARCLGTADVVEAVNFGRERGLEISVRGAGHGVAGRAVTDGGLMIDLSSMKGTHVDPSRQTVRAQGGVTVGELDRAAGAFGLATTGGVVSTTGIGGLTLGGGFGWLMGKHGMTIDNLRSAEVVLASGEIVIASEMEDAELFWAIRGGGGNFGVVTSFEYRAHSLESVLAGPVLHPLGAAPELLRFYRNWTTAATDELTTQAYLLYAPDGSGEKACAVCVCHAGEPHAAEAEIRPLREWGAASADLIQCMPYPVVNTLFDAEFPKGALCYWKSALLTDLSDAAIEALCVAFERSPSPMCAFAIEHVHGAAAQVAPGATAYPHREPGFNLLLIAQWTNPGESDACISWARGVFEALRPHRAERAYVNYLVGDDEERVRHAYGPNYERLASLKRRYDPANLFRLNHNIRPAP